MSVASNSSLGLKTAPLHPAACLRRDGHLHMLLSGWLFSGPSHSQVSVERSTHNGKRLNGYAASLSLRRQYFSSPSYLQDKNPQCTSLYLFASDHGPPDSGGSTPMACHHICTLKGAQTVLCVCFLSQQWKELI